MSILDLIHGLHVQKVRSGSKLKMSAMPPSAISFFLAGGLSCMVSHAVAVPFDVIKTRKQTSATSVSLQQLIKDEGAGILVKGLGPTLIGYAIQGSLKYGFYEVFKTQLLEHVHLSSGLAAPVWVLMLAGASAEMIGSTFLSPFEAARIRLVSNPGFATGLFGCLKRISREEGNAALFFGLPAILAKQVPYTVIQLSTFESFSSTLSITMTDRVSISVTAALAAAFLSSIASQPGDTLLSVVNKAARSPSHSPSPSPSPSPTSQRQSEVSAMTIISEAINELQFRGLFRGTRERLVHVGVIVVTQLLIYDSIKSLMGIPIAGTH